MGLHFLKMNLAAWTGEKLGPWGPRDKGQGLGQELKERC